MIYLPLTFTCPCGDMSARHVVGKIYHTRERLNGIDGATTSTHPYDGKRIHRETVMNRRSWRMQSSFSSDTGMTAEKAFGSVLERPGVDMHVPIRLDVSKDSTGRGIFVEKDVGKGGVIVDIPVDAACICVEYGGGGVSVPMDVSSDTAWPRLNKAVAKDNTLPWDVLISLALLDAMSGMGSECLLKYGNYVLPGPMDLCLPLCMPEEMLCELQDADMERKAKEQKERLRGLFPGLGVPMEEGGPTWMEYAFGCVRSRAFSLGRDAFALVPILDAANHAIEPNADFSFNPNTHSVLLFAMEDIAAGDEITISYTGTVGYTNARMMTQYGFVFENGNPFDRYSLEKDLGIIQEQGYQLSLEYIQSVLGDGDVMVDMFSGKDAYSYACLKSLPIVAGEDAGACCCSSVEEQKTLLRRIRDAVSVRMEQGWKSTLRDDASMLGHMQASDASDARLMAALKYRIQSKKRDLAMHRLTEILLC